MIALVTLPLILVSGVFFPATRLPSVLNAIAQVVPLEHLAHGPRHAMTPHAGTIPIGALDLAVLAAWALVATGVAAWSFQWLPHAR